MIKGKVKKRKEYLINDFITALKTMISNKKKYLTSTLLEGYVHKSKKVNYSVFFFCEH